eukprot:361841_1
MKPLFIILCIVSELFTLSLSISYHLVNDTTRTYTWFEAQAYCETKYGTNLATIIDGTSLSEVIAMRDAMFPSDDVYTWVGLNDQTTEGVWEWVSGASCDPNASGNLCVTFWKENEPSDSNGDENCAELIYPPHNNVYDKACDHDTDRYYFFCDVEDLAPTASPSSSPTGTTLSPSGATPSPSGATSSPSRTTLSPSDATSSPSDATASPSGATPSPSGATSSPSDATASPSGATPSPSGATSSPSDATASPSRATFSPSDATSSPSDATASPSGSTPSPSGETPSPSQTPSDATQSPSEATLSPSDATQSPSDATASPSQPTSSPSEVTSSPSTPSSAPITSISTLSSPAYHLVHDAINTYTWHEAQDFCATEYGTNLATAINNASLQELIGLRDRMFTENVYVWLGLNDETTEGIWEWVSGVSCDPNVESSLCVTYWKENEPSDSNGLENCAELIYASHNTVYDKTCSTGRNQFFCDKQVNYHFVSDNTARNWSDAQAYCEEVYGTNLATVTDETALSEVLAMRDAAFPNTNVYTWVGLNDQAEEGVWEWVSGASCDVNAAENLCVTFWKENEPNDSSGLENCAELIYDPWNTVYDKKCDTERNEFACDAGAIWPTQSPSEVTSSPTVSPSEVTLAPSAVTPSPSESPSQATESPSVSPSQMTISPSESTPSPNRND